MSLKDSFKETLKVLTGEFVNEMNDENRDFLIRQITFIQELYAKKGLTKVDESVQSKVDSFKLKLKEVLIDIGDVIAEDPNPKYVKLIENLVRLKI